MASADLSFTKDGLIYRPQHEEEEDDEDFLTGRSQKDGGTIGRIHGRYTLSYVCHGVDIGDGVVGLTSLCRNHFIVD